jgi:hypothetical protein
MTPQLFPSFFLGSATIGPQPQNRRDNDGSREPLPISLDEHAEHLNGCDLHLDFAIQNIERAGKALSINRHNGIDREMKGLRSNSGDAINVIVRL